MGKALCAPLNGPEGKVGRNFCMGGGLSFGQGRKKKELLEKEKRERDERALLSAAKEREGQERARTSEQELQRLADIKAKEDKKGIEEAQRLAEIQSREKVLQQEQQKIEQEKKELDKKAQSQQEKEIEAQQEEQRRQQLESDLREQQEKLRRLEEILAQRELDLEVREEQSRNRAQEKEKEAALLLLEPSLPLGPKEGESTAAASSGERRLLFSNKVLNELQHDTRYGTARKVSVNTSLHLPGWSVRHNTADENIRQRFIRIFISSSLDGDHEHTLLRSAVYPALISDATHRAVSLHFVDLRDALRRAEAAGRGPEWEARAMGLLLREADRCRPWFVGLLGDSYWGALGEEVCARLEAAGHAWVAEEGLAPASCQDVLTRFAALRGPPADPLAPAACFLLQRAATGPDDAGGGDEPPARNSGQEVPHSPPLALAPEAVAAATAGAAVDGAASRGEIQAAAGSRGALGVSAHCRAPRSRRTREAS